MNGAASRVRFYVQKPHVDGLAVLDRDRSALVISSFGDTCEEAERALKTVATALNAATCPRRSMYATDAFKGVHDSLNWRVIEYLALEDS